MGGGNEDNKMSGGAIPTSANTHGSASGTTRSAVADGTITVRNGQAQTQNVADLSRDTDNANGHIDKIFDKDKVARKLEFAQGMQELGQRVAGDVSSYKMQAAEDETRERLLKANPQYASYSKAELNNLIVNDAGYKAVAEKWGTGGSYSMAAAAVTGVLGGLGASNLGAAAAGGMAPYIANKIKQATSKVVDGQEQTNVLANTMAHAVAGAVLAQLAGNNATAGAAGAAGGELMARAILSSMYPGKQASELTQEQKQVVSALGQLAAQLSAGVASGSVEGGIQGAVVGKNAVENNTLGNDEDEMQRLHGNRPIQIIDVNPLHKIGLLTENGERASVGGISKGDLKAISADSAKLPSGYAANSTGSIVGPKGGIYSYTGKTDSTGNAVYSNNNGYFTFTKGVKSNVASPNAPTQVRQNYEQGKIFEDNVYQDHSADKSVSAREITVKTESGTSVRIDILSKDKNGNIACIECKSSAGAPLTPNQKVGFPEIEKSGAIVVGAGKPGFEGGSQIPPTKVEIIRPDKKNQD
jgi:hypothetical protein